MKKLCLLLTVTLCAAMFLTAGAALADQKADAKALVDSAIAMAKEKGLEATLKAIDDPKGPFIKGDLYIFAGPLDKTTLNGHPYKPQLKGKDMTRFKDVQGKFFFIEFVNVAKDPGEGWVTYMWPKPGEKKPSPKNTFIKRVPGENEYFGCGYYE